jgi:hypothetical protein
LPPPLQAGLTGWWRFQMFSTLQNRWVHYHGGIADYHAGPIGDSGYGRVGDKARTVRQQIESIIPALPLRVPDMAALRTELDTLADALAETIDTTATTRPMTTT